MSKHVSKPSNRARALTENLLFGLGKKVTWVQTGIILTGDQTGFFVVRGCCATVRNAVQNRVERS